MAALQKEVVSSKNSDAMAANQKEGLLTTQNKMSTKNPTTNQNNWVPLNQTLSKQKVAQPST